MARLQINLNYFSLTIIFSLFLLCKSDQTGGTTVGSCITSYNQTVNNQTGLIDDPYRANVQSLFNEFSSSFLPFYNTSIGESPNRAYGLYLCRGDTTPNTCHTCVASIIASSIAEQPGCKENIVFMNECMIHYSNYSFFGTANNESLGSVVGKPNTSEAYNRTIERLLDQVVNDAAYNSATLYATLNATIQGGQERVYGLAQCTPDISKVDCNGCLKAAKSYLVPNITGVAKMGWALLPSCQLRYDNVSFEATSANSSPLLMPTVSAFLLATFCFLFINTLL